MAVEYTELKRFVIRLAERCELRKKITSAEFASAVNAYANLMTLPKINPPLTVSDAWMKMLAREYHTIARRRGGGIFDAPGTPLKLTFRK